VVQLRQLAVRGDEPAVGADRGVGQAQRLAHGAQHTVDAAGEVAADAGGRGRGVGAFAVQQPVDHRLDPVAGRGEHQRDGAGGDDRPRRAVLVGDDAQHGDDAQVSPGDTGGQHAVDERAVDDEANVVQAVPHDGDRRRGRDQREGQHEDDRTVGGHHPLHIEHQEDPDGPQQPQQLQPLHVARTPHT
jgi:hypothetical protein